VLWLIVELTITITPLLKIPPPSGGVPTPPSLTVLSLIVELIMFTGKAWLRLLMPPPCRAMLLLKVERTTFSEPPSLKIPPPDGAVLFLTVTSVKVSDAP
jgi:hypothetical protein